MRTWLLVLVVLGTVALTAELWLLGHTEPFWQRAPLVALAAGLVSALAVAARPSPATLRPFQGLMAVFVVLGLIGVGLHLRGNLEFEREMDPGADLRVAWRNAWTGATPPIAPAALTQLGLLGLVFAWRHPALGHGRPEAATGPSLDSSNRKELR